MINKIDHQLIIALRENGRYSYLKLAKELGVNVSTIARRVNAMLEQDIISIKAVPNPFKMGYQASAFIALEVDLKRIDEICAQLVDNSNVTLILTTFGRFDILIIANFRELAILDDFVKKVLPRIKGINKINTFFIADEKKRYYGMFANDTKTNNNASLDDFDQGLIKELSKDGRTKYSDLAIKFGVDLSTVSRRVNNLIKEDIIKIMVVPNPSKLGYPANAFIGIYADALKINEICAALSVYSEVHYIVTLVNGFEILVSVQFPNPEMLYAFIKHNIANIDGILRVETFIRAEFKKRIYTWLPM